MSSPSRIIDIKATLYFAAGLLYTSTSYAEINTYQHESITATGFVYHDANENRKKDLDEIGIANVAVSNGHDVTLTNEAGFYSIEIDEDTAIFVVKPPHWNLPLNEYNLPQFYYLHKPHGSPNNLKYAGVSPTGPLPNSVDFALHKNGDENVFRVLLFGDPQPRTLEHIDFFERDIVDELTGTEGLAFGITLGDIVNDNLDHFEPVNKAVARIGIPFFNVYGNHDMNFDVKHDHLADESFERVYGPATYAFRHGKALFIILDNVVYPDNRGRYIGGFTKDQLAFVRNVLETVPKDTLIVMSMHIPLFEQSMFGNTFRNEDRDALFSLLESFQNTFSLSAHTHSQRHHFFDTTDNWLQETPHHHHYNVGTTSGSWWNGPLDERGIPNRMMHDGTPAGYAFLDINGNQYTYSYKVANASAEKQLRIYIPKVMRKSDYRTPVMANVFNATEDAKVQHRITGYKNDRWRTMKRFETVDPHYMQLFLKRDMAEEPVLGGRFGFPSHSKHLWRGYLPKDLKSGEHRVEVRWTDIFGRIFTETAEFRVE